MDVENYSGKDLFALAGIAEAAERYEDMTKLLKKLVEEKCEEKKALSIDERNLLSVAYKNIVGAKRQSWRTLSQGRFTELPEDLLNQYKSVVEAELEAVCTEVIDLLKLLTSSTKDNDELTAEDKVFHLKMCGDYYRYLSEFQQSEDSQNNAESFYKQAFEIAKEELPETHPTRLGLALNYSVCLYEILKQKEAACTVAKEAFDSAIEKLDTLNDGSYKDSTLIMQLLRDNLTLWTSENDNGQDEEQS